VAFSCPLELIATKRRAGLDGANRLMFPPEFLSRLLSQPPSPRGRVFAERGWKGPSGRPVPTIGDSKIGMWREWILRLPSVAQDDNPENGTAPIIPNSTFLIPNWVGGYCRAVEKAPALQRGFKNWGAKNRRPWCGPPVEISFSGEAACCTAGCRAGSTGPSGAAAPDGCPAPGSCPWTAE